MYSNVPTADLIGIIDLICDQQFIDEKMKRELISLSKKTYCEHIKVLVLSKPGLQMAA